VDICVFVFHMAWAMKQIWRAGTHIVLALPPPRTTYADADADADAARYALPNRQKRLRHCYRRSRYACARSAPEQASVRAKRAPTAVSARDAPRGRPMAARAKANDKDRGKTASKSR
jgi:hypothetical protein